MSVFDGSRGAKPDWNSEERIPARRLLYFNLKNVFRLDFELFP